MGSRNNFAKPPASIPQPSADALASHRLVKAKTNSERAPKLERNAVAVNAWIVKQAVDALQILISFCRLFW